MKKAADIVNKDKIHDGGDFGKTEPRSLGWRRHDQTCQEKTYVPWRVLRFLSVVRNNFEGLRPMYASILIYCHSQTGYSVHRWYLMDLLL